MLKHCIVAIGLLVGSASAQPADLVLHNGVVHAVAARETPATAVAVRGGVIVAVGDDETALALRGADTRTIDLRGRLLLPGFNDSTVHFQRAAALLELDLMDVTTQEAFATAVRDVVAELEEGQWIVGGLWGAMEPWTPGGGAAFTPDVRAVEEITGQHPLLIRRFDGTVYAANRAALVAAGLDPEDPAAPDVEFLRDADGRLTGLMKGTGVEALFGPHEPRTSLARRERQTRRALRTLARYGVTSLCDISSDSVQYRLFERLRDAGGLTCRTYVRAPLSAWRELGERGLSVGSGDAWVRKGAVVGAVDGTVADHTACMLEPYTDAPGVRGTWARAILGPDGAPDRRLFAKLLRNADMAGLQICLEADGDEAVRVSLRALATVERARGGGERRFRLVGAQVIAPGDVGLLGGVHSLVAEVQPNQVAGAPGWMEERIGPERCAGAYAFRSMQDQGAVLAFGSDWPGPEDAAVPPNPLLGIYAAVTRQDADGQPPAGWFPEQRVALEDAIRAATLGGAFASFQERKQGTVEAGKVADLVVLSRNILEAAPRELLDTEVDITIVDGRVVFERAKASAPPAAAPPAAADPGA